MDMQFVLANKITSAVHQPAGPSVLLALTVHKIKPVLISGAETHAYKRVAQVLTVKFTITIQSAVVHQVSLETHFQTVLKVRILLTVFIKKLENFLKFSFI